MSDLALAAIERVIAALTYDAIERTEVDAAGVKTVTIGEAIPLLQRSVSGDLEMIAREVPKHARLLRALGAAIDEALLAGAEAQAALRKVAA